METNRPPLIDEGTIIDVESAVEELREQLKPWYHKKNPGSSDAQYYTWFEESEAPRFKRIIDPVVLGAKPASWDPTVRFARIPITHDTSLIVRFWAGRQYGYFFDTIDSETKIPICPPCKIEVEYWDREDWFHLPTSEEISTGHISHTLAPQWVTPHGSRLRFKSIDSDRILGTLFVPNAPTDDQVFENFVLLEDALRAPL